MLGVHTGSMRATTGPVSTYEVSESSGKTMRRLRASLIATV